MNTVRGKRPLVIIPGILGTELANSKTGETVWPTVFRTKGDDLRLPISADLQSNRDDLVPKGIVDSLKVSRLVPEVIVYRELLFSLKQYGGYTEGNWTDPGSDGDSDKFYVFAYDWRRDNVENAKELVDRLEALKTRLGRPDLRFNILAHSMGGLIARYAAEYGNADLPPEGVAPTPTWAGAAHISKILMFGTPNEGSADAFATLIDGYSLTEGLRNRLRLLNKLARDDCFTAPSLFQLLPHGGAARFLDGDLKPIQVDLYDPATWRKYAWSAAYDENYRKHLALSGQKEGAKHTSLEELDAYMEAVLSRAKRFHEALDAPLSTDQPVTLLAFGGDCEETLDAPVIIRDEKRARWITLVEPRSLVGSNQKQIPKKAVAAAMYSPGDGRVTRHSLLADSLTTSGLGPQFVKAGLPFAYAVFACDSHGDLQTNKTLQDNALTALLAELVK
jgi:pimeloyl-ACP methyl ester carboxylesterase